MSLVSVHKSILFRTHSARTGVPKLAQTDIPEQAYRLDPNRQTRTNIQARSKQTYTTGLTQTDTVKQFRSRDIQNGYIQTDTRSTRRAQTIEAHVRVTPIHAGLSLSEYPTPVPGENDYCGLRTNAR
jgi:hypothetical protein